jgi:hypothetical protein
MNKQKKKKVAKGMPFERLVALAMVDIPVRVVSVCYLL